MEKSNKPAVAVNLKSTKYSTTLSPAVAKLGWKMAKHNSVGKNKDWDILWTDSSKGAAVVFIIEVWIRKLTIIVNYRN